MSLEIRQFLAWIIRALAATLALTSIRLVYSEPAAQGALDKFLKSLVALTEFLPFAVVLLIILKLFIKTARPLLLIATALVLALYTNYQQYLVRDHYFQNEYIPKYGASYSLAAICQNSEKPAIRDYYGTFLFLRQYLKGADVYVSKHDPYPINLPREPFPINSPTGNSPGGWILSGASNLYVEDFSGVCDEAEAANIANDSRTRTYSLLNATLNIIPTEQKSYRMCSSGKFLIFRPFTK